jgi:hypothetical protein
VAQYAGLELKPQYHAKKKKRREKRKRGPLHQMLWKGRFPRNLHKESCPAILQSD